MFNFNPRMYCNYSNYKFYVRSCSNCKMVSHLLGLPESDVEYYLEKYGITKKNPDLIEGCIKYCQQLGYTSEGILKTKGLLNSHPVKLEHHYLSLEEGGFCDIRPEILSSAVKCMRKSLQYLKWHKLIGQNANIRDNFLSYIKDSNFVKHFRETDRDLSQPNELTKWIDIHFNILQAFLKYKLNASNEDLIKLFRIHKMIRYKSFRVIEENIDIAQSLDIYPERILKYGYLLNNYPKYTKETLEKFPSFGRYETRKLMKAYPKLVMISPANIRKICDILKEYNIPEEAIVRKPNVLCMSPDTIRSRLEAVDNSPELKGLLTHLSVLSLVFHHNRLNSRLTFLQQLKLRCTNFTVLGTSLVDNFERYVRSGKDVNSISTVKAILKTLFPEENEKVAYDRLKLHKCHLYVPVKDMYDSYKTLVDRGFKPIYIFKVLWVILYPSTKIEKALEQLRCDFKITFDTFDQVTQLNLLLYEMEKRHHFTGDGIWREIGVIDDLTEKTLE